jgi:hypothetical protein
MRHRTSWGTQISNESRQPFAPAEPVAHQPQARSECIRYQFARHIAPRPVQAASWGRKTHSPRTAAIAVIDCPQHLSQTRPPVPPRRFCIGQVPPNVELVFFVITSRTAPLGVPVRSLLPTAATKRERGTSRRRGATIQSRPARSGSRPTRPDTRLFQSNAVTRRER